MNYQGKLCDYKLNIDFPTAIAWDGSYLWLADIRENVLIKIDPADGKEVIRWKSPVQRPLMILWHKQELLQLSEETWKLYRSL